MELGSIVILHLAQPAEKYWGRLEHLSAAGVTLRGLNLDSFEDWTRSVAAREDPPAIGPVSVFFPLHRIERVFLDEQVGEVESLSQSFERHTGQRAADLLVGFQEASPLEN